MTVFRRTFIATAMFALHPGVAPAQVAPSPLARVAWEPFTLRTYDGGSREVDLGRLSVPESRARASGPTVSLAFLRLKSTNPSPAAPIVFLMGGPGIAATLMAPIPPYWSLFDSLRSVGDVILLDQRGLGLSTPNVDCPRADPPDTGFLSSRAKFVTAYRRVIANCAMYYRSRGVDPLAFTDAAIADDIDDIRAALGVPRVSLLGFSYGTRLALAFARRHPERLERIVLQGPTDDQMMYRSGAALDSLYRRVARAAAADSISASFSADLVSRTKALLERTASKPVTVRVASASGDSVTLPVGSDVLAGIIMGRIADPRIPALIATLEREDLSVLRLWVSSMYADLAQGAGSLMARAVTCSQVPGRQRIAAVDAATPGTLFGPAFDNFIVAPEFCGALGEPLAMPAKGATAPIATPALLIVGTDDDRTPVSNAAALQRGFTKPVTLVVENGGHELLPSPDVRTAVVDFFRGVSVSGRSVRLPPIRFLSIDDARRPLRRPGQ